MRRLLPAALAAAALAFSAVPAAAEEPIREFRICDLDGHCDRTCGIYATQPVLRCGA